MVESAGRGSIAVARRDVPEAGTNRRHRVGGSDSERATVASHGVDALVGGVWQTIATGTTIGHKKLDRVPSMTVQGIRLRIASSIGAPQIATIAVWPGRP